jgi:hypothetical protein
MLLHALCGTHDAALMHWWQPGGDSTRRSAAVGEALQMH